MKPRGRLFREYVIVLAVLVSGPLLASGAIGVYLSYQQNKTALVALQREKARAAATKIDGFIKEIERQIGWATQPQLGPAAAQLDQRRVEYLRLQKQVPAITENSYVGADGREQQRVSRLAMDVVGSGLDFSREPKFLEARGGRVYYGPVYFRKESEPYMTIAVGAASRDGGVTVAEVNLKFIWDVVSQIKVGKAGHAFVVDGQGTLIAHPDISLVLQKTTLAGLEQVKAALAGPAGPLGEPEEVTLARDMKGQRVLTAQAAIVPLRWSVFVEQPLDEAFAPLWAAIQQTAVLVLVGVLLSIVASVLLARKMVTPIQALQEGAARIGAGELDQRIDVRTGDELEALAQQFNSMAAQLQESYAGLERKVEERTRALTETLEQQTATAEILRVISSSPTDVQPVFETILANGARLCEASFAALFRYDGEALTVVAHQNASPELVERFRTFRARPSTEGPTRRAALERRTVHITDLPSEPGFKPILFRGGYARTVLSVPLLRENTLVGVITMWRLEVRPFTDKQVALVQTFADQAVIAIENVRLFTELQERNRQVTEALEQQTATSEILRVISSSPTDVQPVLDAVAESAARLCGANDAIIYRVEGDLIRLAAHFGSMPLASAAQVRPVTPGTVTGRAIVERRTIHVRDIAEEHARGEYPEGRAIREPIGYRTLLVAPLMREDVVVGAITIRRLEVDPFSDKQIQLLQTFADQAVIAIENVRLFTELQERNRQVTEALEQQTATSEILRVISSSPTDVQPVFDAIVKSAARLCDAAFGGMVRVDGEVISLGARHNMTEEQYELMARAFPMRIEQAGAIGEAIRTRRVVHVRDFTAVHDPSESGYAFAAAQPVLGYRTILVVPMLHDESVIGAVLVWRREVAPFSDKQIALLETFADQAVIAIENVRLFTELEERNRQVTEALEQQTATAEILRVISSSPTDVQPVLDAVAESAARLCGATDAILLRVDGDVIRRAAHFGEVPVALSEVRPLTPRTVAGRAILERRTIHIPDVQAGGVRDEYPDAWNSVRPVWYQTIFVTPLLREDAAIGAIVIRRLEMRPFTEKQIDLLKTFADQAVIAIENVRLFKELEERTRALSRSVEELTALGEVGRAVSSTLDVETVLNTIVSRASQLARADGCSIYEYDPEADEFRLRAAHNYDPAVVETIRAMPLRKGEGVMGRAAETREPIQIPDIAAPGVYQSRQRDVLVRAGYRALLSVPLLREDEIIGSLSLNRRVPGEFPAEVVDLLKTFATQSALALQNARLFEEIAEKSRLLEVANRHKSEFLANMSHELRTPLNAIIGFSEVLIERMFGELNEKQDEYLKDIFSSGRHLLSLINDILDLSKIEAGRMELELGKFDLPAAMENALTLVKGRAANHGIALHLEVDRRLGEVVADERKIKQVLVNLLSNAVKFTPEGGRVALRAAPANGGVEITVADTGIGIAAEDQEVIFEEFRQVGTDYAKKREGTGLGLALTKRIVGLHGGRIWVKSEVGEGSTFTFSLPERPWPAS